MDRHVLRWSCGTFAAWCAIATAAADDRRQNAADETPSPPYVQSAVVEPKPGTGVILGFCVPSGGGLVAVIGHSERYGAGPQRPAAAKQSPHRLAWFDADGVEIRAVDLDFAATVVAAGPDGGICVAGDGVVAIVSAEGREIARATTPQIAKTDEELAELEKSVLARRDVQFESFMKQAERLRAGVEELEEKARTADEAAAEAADGDEADSDKAKLLVRLAETRARNARLQARNMSVQLRQIEAAAKSLQSQDPRQLVDQAVRKMRQVRAVSSGGDAIFVVVPEASGYGFSAWRYDARLENPEQVLSKLVGCCSQMDVQVIGDRLAIAQNRKHCVELTSFAGETIATVGRRIGGADPVGFGGCCNPMNTCPAPDGSLLTSESDGVVKRFDAEGEFVEVVGKAEVRGGCKNSAIAIEPDGSRLYYIDSTRGSVLVLTKAAAREAAAAKPAPPKPIRKSGYVGTRE